MYIVDFDGKSVGTKKPAPWIRHGIQKLYTGFSFKKVGCPKGGGDKGTVFQVSFISAFFGRSLLSRTSQNIHNEDP